ncbi:MAG: hypothetical protein WC243_03090 [Patescibacteria group bacterium]|jgi:hypothetical protein
MCKRTICGVSALLLLVITFFLVFILRKPVSTPNVEPTPEQGVTRVIEGVGEESTVFLEGTIRKEAIPRELELGDYWYWIYFDTPVLQKNNASGVPLYIDKMQLNPPIEKDFYNIEDFVDKSVEVYGYQTWGYAESSVFQILSLRAL